MLSSSARAAGQPCVGTGPVLPVVMVLIAVFGVLTATPADGQVSGRRGFTWQPEIQLARDELAQLQAELDRLSREEWRKRALAWLEVGFPAEDRLLVTESWHVGDLAFKKKAEVRVLDDPDMPSSWEVVFDEKPQRKVTVVMTDVDSTRVACSLGAVLDDGGALGVFQQGDVLLCLARLPDTDETPSPEVP